MTLSRHAVPDGVRGRQPYVYAFNTAGIPQVWFGSGGVASRAVGANIYPVFDIAQWAATSSAWRPARAIRSLAISISSWSSSRSAARRSPVSAAAASRHSRVWTGVGGAQPADPITFQPDGRIVAADARQARRAERLRRRALSLRRYARCDIRPRRIQHDRFGSDDFGRRIAQQGRPLRDRRQRLQAARRDDGSLRTASPALPDCRTTVASTPASVASAASSRISAAAVRP